MTNVFLRWALALKAMLVAFILVVGSSSTSHAADFTLQSVPNNFTAILADGNGNTITVTVSPQNTTCASINGAGRITLFPSQYRNGCNQSMVMTYTTNGFLLDQAVFGDIDDVDGTTPRDSFAANVPGTWASPTIEIHSLTGPAPSWLSAAEDRRDRLTASGGVGNFLANDFEIDPTNESATFTLDTPAQTFAILVDDVQGARHARLQFNLASINVDIAPKLTLEKVVDNSNGGSAVPGDFTLSYDDGAGNSGSGVTGSAAVTAVEIPVGNYTISETSDPNYDQSLVCVGSADSNPANGLNLTDAEDVTCTFTNTFVPDPELTVAKTVTGSSISSPPAVGNTITYQVVVANEGNVDISGVTPVDAGPTFNGNAPAGAALSWSTSDSTTLAPGDDATFTATYTLVAADVAALTAASDTTTAIANSATATGAPSNGTLPAVTPSTTTSGYAPAPELSVAKTSTGQTISTPPAVGDTVSYQIVVSNTGNVDVSGVVPVDNGPTFDGTAAAGTTPAWTTSDSTTLKPGDSATFTGTYTLVAADVAALTGASDTTTAIANSATASGTPTDGTLPAVTPSTAETGYLPSPSMTAAKSVAAANFSDPPAPLDVISYEVVLTNTGNVDITGATPVDAGPTFDGVAHAGADLFWQTTGDGILKPGEAETFTANYILVQADVDALSAAADPSTAVDNTATATGTPTDGTLPAVPGSSAQTGYAADPSMSVAKSVTATNLSTPPAVGDTIDYQVVLTNTGNTDLSGVTPVDTGPTIDGNAHQGANLSWSTTDSTTLQPGATATFVATYTLVAGDVTNLTNAADTSDAIANTANATGTPASGALPIPTPSSADTGYTANPGIEVEKLANISGLADPVVAGNPITFTINVANTGNVALTNVTLDDDFTRRDGTVLALSVPATPSSGDAGTVGTLDVGETWSYQVTYNLLQEDINGGGVENTVEATADEPSGGSVSDVSDDGIDGDGNTTNDPTVIAIPGEPEISMAKTLASGPNPFDTVGQVLTFEFEVTNIGNVTLTAPISINDPLIAAQGTGPVTCPTGPILPNGSITCTGSYEITQDDLNNGEVENSATASVTQPVIPENPGDPTVVTSTTTPSIVNVPATIDASVTIGKELDATSAATYAAVGDELVFKYTVTNDGNVTLAGPFNVDDDKIGTDLACGTGPLDPGESVTCTHTWTADQGALNDGEVTNVADAKTTHDGSSITSDAPGASVTVPATVNESLALVKTITSVVPDTLDVNSVISYDFVVTNDGNVSIDAPITINDTKATGITCPTPAGGALLPGTSITCTGTYTMNAGDVAVGSVTNVASALGAYGGLPVASPDASETYNPTGTAPSMTLTKDSVPSTATFDETFANDGSQISYTYTVTNTSSVGFTEDITINDDKIGSFVCYDAAVEGTLSVGASHTCTATYDVLQEDLDNGSVTNTATAATVFAPGQPNETTVLSNEADKTVDAVVNPSMNFSKVVTNITDAPLGAAGNDVGDIVEFTLTANNDGNQSLYNIEIVDPDLPTMVCEHESVVVTGPVTLEPSESLICVGNYTVTQDDFDAQSLVNVGNVTGVDPQGDPVDESDSVSVPLIAPTPNIEITKEITPAVAPGTPVFTQEGDTVSFQISVENTGDVTLETIAITDDLPVLPATCDLARLEVGEKLAVCTVTYTVTQDDVDAINGIAPTTYGGFTNIARVTAVDATPSENPVGDDGSVFVRGPDQAPGFTLEKSADVTQVLTVGETINYEFVVTNSGNVTLTAAPTVTDTTTPAGTVIPVTCPAFPGGELDPGDSITCTASYQVTQDDMNYGSLTNVAQVSSTEVPVPVTPGAETDTLSLPVVRTPSVSILKEATPTSDVAEGEVVTYTYTVENDGNVTLTNVTIDDQHTSAAGTTALTVAGEALDTDTAPAGDSLDAGADGSWDTLEPGDIVSFTASYTVTREDINQQVTLANTATVTAETPAGLGNATDTDTETVAVEAPDPEITTLKSLSLAGLSSPPIAGETLNYTITVTNTGNQDLTNFGLTDAFKRLDNTPITPTPALTYVSGDTGVAGVFEVDEIRTYSFTYVLKQADIDAGGVSNQATAQGDSPSGTTVSDPSDDGNPANGGNNPTLLEIPATPGIEGEKTLTQGVGEVGSMLIFEITATNTGNVTLTNTGIQSETLQRIDGTPLTPSSTIYVGSSLGSAVGTLLPNEVATYEVRYTLTQEDIDAGGVRNSATVSGRDPSNTPVNDITDDGNDGDGNSTNDPTELLVAADPKLLLDKKLSASSPVSYDAVDQTISFDFVVTNDGNVTLTNAITIDDPLIDGAGGSVTCPSLPLGGLAPGASLTCTGSYDVTQGNINDGSFVNTATASSGPTTSPSDSQTVTAVQRYQLSMVKTAETVAPTDFVFNAMVNYTYLLTNEGNTTQVGPFTVVDNLIAPANISCPTPPGNVLQPGESLTCTGVYSVTLADLDTGSVTNLATGSSSTTQSPIGSATIPEEGVAALEIEKGIVSGADFSEVGDTITYEFIVKNSGTRTLVDPIIVEDAHTGPVTCWQSTGLDPDFQADETATCQGTYQVDQDDLDAGEVFNQAYAATTVGVNDDPLNSAPDDHTTPAFRMPSIELTKSVATLPVTAVNQTLTYTLIATNNGNQTLYNVEITDPLLAGFSCTVPQLDRGQTLECNGTYDVMQTDIDAGSLTNEADVSATTPQGTKVTDDVELTVAMPNSMPDMVLHKNATPSPFGAVGSMLTYQLSVENTGNVTLFDVVVNDPMGGGDICTIPEIAPNTTVGGCSFSIEVTQDMLDAGSVTNDATAVGEDPFNAVVDAEAELVTPSGARMPSLEATKILLGGNSVLGGLVQYSLAVENTGNVTLFNVNVVDQMQTLLGSAAQLDAPFALVPASDTDGDGHLDVDETWMYTGEVTLRQIDLNHAGLSNQVTVTADGPPGAGSTMDVSDDGDDSDGNTTNDPTIFEAAIDPELTVVKTVMTPGFVAGDQVVFEITATNTGNQDLTGLSVSDTLTNLDGASLTAAVSPQSVPAVLSPTQDAVWWATYTLTQADVDSGGLENSATVSGLSPDNTPVSDISADDDPLDGNLSDDPTTMLIAAEPAMVVIKQVVSAGNRAGETVEYEVTVENTGNVSLDGMALTDTASAIDGSDVRTLVPVFVSNDGTPPSPAGTLVPGETATYSVTLTLTQDDIEKGGVSNTITATGNTPNAGPIEDISDDDGTGDSDPTVTPIDAVPSLAVTKVGSEPEFLFYTVEQSTFTITVENNGNITQNNVQVTDDLKSFLAPATLHPDYPIIVTAEGFTNGEASTTFNGIDDIALLQGSPTLNPGEIGTITITMVYSTTEGFPVEPNTASAISDELEEPATGQGDLTPSDIDGDGIPDYEDFDPTGHFYCEENGLTLSNGVISVSGNGFTQTGVGTTGPIVIIEDGSTGFYQFYVTAPGTYTLTATYPPVGAPSTSRLPGGTLDATTLLPDNPARLGSATNEDGTELLDFTADANPFYFVFEIEAGDPMILGNNIPLQSCSAEIPIVATKIADRDTAVYGETVNFTLTFENISGVTYTDVDLIDQLPEGMLYTPNTARVNGAKSEPRVNGSQLIWTETLAPSDVITITFAARVVSRGNFGVLTNETWAQGSDGRVLSNVATADVDIRPEHVFDCSDVIGKVFDDKNRNGYQDGPGSSRQAILQDDNFFGKYGKFSRRPAEVNTVEPGIADVRLVSPNGTIITTDAYGRFSVPCAALPRTIGSNFLLKLDTRTLPTGYRVTTENPRVIRVTPGKIAKLNFGATLGRVVDIDLSATAFVSGSNQPVAKLENALKGLINQIRDTQTSIDITYVLGNGESTQNARSRLSAVKQILKRNWHGKYRLDVGTNVVRRQ